MSSEKFPNSEIISLEEKDKNKFEKEMKNEVEKFVNNIRVLDLRKKEDEDKYIELIIEFANLDEDKEIFQQKQRLNFLKNYLNYIDKQLNLIKENKDDFLVNAEDISVYTKIKNFIEQVIGEMEIRLSSNKEEILNDKSQRVEEALSVSKDYLYGEYVDIEGKRYKKKNGSEIRDTYYAKKKDEEIEADKLIKKYKENVEWYLEQKKNEYKKNNLNNPLENFELSDEIKTYKDMQRVWNKIQATEYPKMKLDKFYLDELRKEQREEFNGNFDKINNDIFSIQRKKAFEEKLKKAETFQDIERIEKEFLTKLDFSEKQNKFKDFYEKNNFKIDNFESFKDDYNNIIVEYDLNVLRKKIEEGKYSYEIKRIENEKKKDELKDLEKKLEKSKKEEESFLYKWAKKIIDGENDGWWVENDNESLPVDVDELDDLIPVEEKKPIFNRFKEWVAGKIIDLKGKNILDDETKKQIEKKKEELKKEIQKNKEFFDNFEGGNLEKTLQLKSILESYSDKININNWKEYDRKIKKDIQEKYPDAIIPNYLVIDGKMRRVNFRKDYQDDLREEINLVKEEYRDNEYNTILSNISKIKTYKDVKELKQLILEWKKNKVDEVKDRDIYNSKEKKYERKIDFTKDEMEELRKDFDKVREVVKKLDEIQNRLENPSWWDIFKSNKINYKGKIIEFKSSEEVKEFRNKNNIDKTYNNYKKRFVVFRIADI